MVARHPLGNWTDMGYDINPLRPWSVTEHVVPSQNNYVLQVRVAGNNTTYVFTADLWSSASDKLKSHDRQFWAPLQFDDTVSPPTIAPLVWTDSFELDLASADRIVVV
jgi:hypothetical protein